MSQSQTEPLITSQVAYTLSPLNGLAFDMTDVSAGSVTGATGRLQHKYRDGVLLEGETNDAHRIGIELLKIIVRLESFSNDVILNARRPRVRQGKLIFVGHPRS